MIHIDYRDSRPIYAQVKDGMRRLIVTGVMRPGEKIPSVRALAEQLTINPNTISRAYSELESEGFIVTVVGRGSFVAEASGQNEIRKGELKKKIRPLIEELKNLGMNEEEFLELWKGGD